MTEVITQIKDFGGMTCTMQDQRLVNQESEGFEVVTNKQTIRLWISTTQNCCEQTGYFMSHDDVREFIGAELLSVSVTDTALNKVSFVNNGVDNTTLDGNIMFVNLETSKGTLQFVAYNDHNGYYGHDAGVICAQLNHWTTI